MDYFHTVQHTKGKRIGVGGYKCYCCGPKPKDRPKLRRATRRIDKHYTRLMLKSL